MFKVLGKLPARHDPRTLRMLKYLAVDMPAPPPSVDYTPSVTSRNIAWGMMRNDTAGDCTIAAAAHMEMLWMAGAGQVFIPTDDSVIAAYSAVSGYQPGTGMGDVGAAEIDVLNYWRQIGISGRKILAFAAIDPGNFQHIKLAVWMFEGCYIGLQLPLSASDQFDAGEIWEIAPESVSQSRREAGSWGGHAVNVVGYDAEGITFVTWGQTLTMTWGFWAAYCDEAYAVLSADMLIDGNSPAGFDLQKLRDDLGAIGDFPEQIVPAPAPPAPDAKPVGVILLLAGLGTDPAGDCCGMRLLAERVVAAHPQIEWHILAFGWDQTPPSPYTAGPDGLSRFVRDQILALKPAFLIGEAHSFGGAFGVFLNQWAWNWYSGPAKDNPPFVFDAWGEFDGKPNKVRFGEGQDPGWFIPLTTARLQYAPYQRNGIVAFIKGEALFEQGEPGQVTNRDVTALQNPQLGHVDNLLPPLTCLIKDTRPGGVQDDFLAMVSKAIASKV